MVLFILGVVLLLMHQDRQFKCIFKGAVNHLNTLIIIQIGISLVLVNPHSIYSIPSSITLRPFPASPRNIYPFRTLGIIPISIIKEIKATYKKLIRFLNPDKYNNNKPHILEKGSKKGKHISNT